MQFFAKDLMTLGNALKEPPPSWEAERSALAVESLRASGRLRLQVRGESMLPVLWPGDVVEILSCTVEDVRPGEIVLAMRGGRFFLHRFLARSQSDGFLLRGDSMPAPDPRFPNEALLGRLVSAGRDKNQSKVQKRTRPILPLRFWFWAIGQLLCYCGPARRLALRLHAGRAKCACELRSTESAAESVTSAAQAGAS